MSRRPPATPSDRAWSLRVLGPFDLRHGDASVVMRPQGRVLLSWLALHPDGVELGRLVELSWGTSAPAGAARQAVELLRSAGEGLATIVAGRARLDRTVVEVDEDRFTQLLRGNPERSDVEAALDLWRGDPYPDLRHHPDALAGIHRLEQHHDRAMAAVYSHRLLEPEVARAVADLSADALLHPTSSRLRRLLAAGLAMTGRRVEALRAARAAAEHEPPGNPWAATLEHAIQTDDIEALRGLVGRIGG